jgi:uncharacterized protein DUF3300
MNIQPLRRKCRSRVGQSLVAALCVLSLAPGDTAVYAQPTPQQNGTADQAAPKISNDQLDSLVAPIALYPDPLLTQMLVASTYPLEIIQLQQWLGQHKDLKDQALTDAVQKQDWDPSVQAMAVIPDAVKQLAENIKWTTDLGNAFLAQQSDVMDAVQRMRMKAKDAGNLKSTEQQKVETKVVETKTVVVIQQANPQVVYVPSYNPVVVYGPPVYPYPPIVYPPPSYYAAGVAIAFGVGIALGAAYHGGWGYNSGWGSNNKVTINNNNNFVNNSNRQNINNANRNNINNPNRSGNSNWQHNPQHRGGAPYSDKATASKYGGTARGDSTATRQANARQSQGQQGARQQPGTMDRGAGGGTASSRPTGGGAGATGANRPSTGASNTGGNRTSTGASNTGGNRTSTGASNTGANRTSTGASNTGANRSGGAESVGNRQVPNTPSGKSTSAFGGAASGTSGGAAKASSQRGAASTGASRGGGGGGRKN